LFRKNNNKEMVKKRINNFKEKCKETEKKNWIYFNVNEKRDYR
jgi:hypothetical protein